MYIFHRVGDYIHGHTSPKRKLSPKVTFWSQNRKQKVATNTQ